MIIDDMQQLESIFPCDVILPNQEIGGIKAIYKCPCGPCIAAT